MKTTFFQFELVSKSTNINKRLSHGYGRGRIVYRLVESEESNRPVILIFTFLLFAILDTQFLNKYVSYEKINSNYFISGQN